MPEKMTFRDVVPILDSLVMDVKFPILSKSDLVFRKKIAENIDCISEFDFEEIAIATHSLGDVGNIIAKNIREKSAELASAIQKFWYIFKDMERNRKTRHEDFDIYESKNVLGEFEAIKKEIIFYELSLMAAGVLPCNEEMKNIPASTEPIPSESTERKIWDETLFPMQLTCKLHELCEGMFKDMSEAAFHSSLNMDGKHEPLQVIKGHTIKLCYMLSRLYDLVPTEKKQEWRDDVLAYLNISPDYYFKKY